MRKYYYFSPRRKSPFKGVLAYDSDTKEWLAHPPTDNIKKFKTIKAKNIEQVRDVFKHNKLLKVVVNGKEVK